MGIIVVKSTVGDFLKTICPPQKTWILTDTCNNVILKKNIKFTRNNVLKEVTVIAKTRPKLQVCNKFVMAVRINASTLPFHENKTQKMWQFGILSRRQTCLLSIVKRL